MAYNRKNLLKRIIDVQEVYLHWQSVGLDNRTIWREHLYPTYKICEATMYNYLAINAKKELKDIIAAEAAQVKMEL